MVYTRVLIIIIASTYCLVGGAFELIRSNPSEDFTAYVNRVESLTFIDKILWQSDDSRKTSAGQNPNFPSEFSQIIADRDLFFGAPGLGTSSLNLREIETIAHDGDNILYMVNTVNNKGLCGSDIVDLPTIFKLHRKSVMDEFVIKDWHLLPKSTECDDGAGVLQSTYSSMAVINKRIYFSHKREIRKYNYKRQLFKRERKDLLLPRSLPSIRDMAYDGTHLWILGYFNRGLSPDDHWLTKVHWKTRKIVDAQNLAAFDLTAARGLAINGNKIYIGENRKVDKNIHVATILDSEDLSEAIFDKKDIIFANRLMVSSTASRFPNRSFSNVCSADAKDSKTGIETCYIFVNLEDYDLAAYSKVQLNFKVKNNSKKVEIYAHQVGFMDKELTFNNNRLGDGDRIYAGKLSKERTVDMSVILEKNSLYFVLEIYAPSSDGVGIYVDSINVKLE